MKYAMDVSTREKTSRDVKLKYLSDQFVENNCASILFHLYCGIRNAQKLFLWNSTNPT
jgi:hypothetical protein